MAYDELPALQGADEAAGRVGAVDQLRAGHAKLTAVPFGVHEAAAAERPALRRGQRDSTSMGPRSPVVISVNEGQRK